MAQLNGLKHVVIGKDTYIQTNQQFIYIHSKKVNYVMQKINHVMSGGIRSYNVFRWWNWLHRNAANKITESRGYFLYMYFSDARTK